jgi:hypothetical protein
MDDKDIRDALINAKANATHWKWEEKYNGTHHGSLNGGETWGLALIALAEKMGYDDTAP